MVSHISDNIKAMAEKEKLNKNNSLMELKNLVKQFSHSEKSDTTDSFSNTTIEKNHPDTTEESENVTTENNTSESNEQVLSKSTAIAITHLVKNLFEEFTQPQTVGRLEQTFNINATTLKKTVHDMEKNASIEETDKKTKK